MIQVVKHLGLIIALLAWVVLPLPECYLTKPNCPKRNNISSCQALNHQQPNIKTTETSSCCGGVFPGGENEGVTSARASSQEGERTLVASLSPMFLLPDSPDLPGPHAAFTLSLQTATAPSAASGFHSPYHGERADPIPILLRTQTLLI